jgi:hypothetical protein
MFSPPNWLPKSRLNLVRGIKTLPCFYTLDNILSKTKKYIKHLRV